MKNKPKILLFVFLAVSVFYLGGCKSLDPGPKFGLEGRLGVDIVNYNPDLGEKISTTPVHPADSTFLSGKTTTSPSGYDSDHTDFAPKLGLFATLGDENLKVVGGIDWRWNPLHHSDGYREGIYSARQQVSDFRPPSSGSFVFTQVIPGAFTLIPSVGIEGKLGEKLILGGSIGFPYMEWEARSGHDRWGSWETVQHDSWKGFGMRYAATIGLKLNDRNRFLLSFFQEKYRPDFAGEGATISGRGLLFSLVHSF